MANGAKKGNNAGLFHKLEKNNSKSLIQFWKKERRAKNSSKHRRVIELCFVFCLDGRDERKNNYYYDGLYFFVASPGIIERSLRAITSSFVP